MINIEITWKDKETWMMFKLSDIIERSRNHAIDLFSNKVPVIAKQDSIYITNSATIYDSYKRKGTPVYMFAELQRNEGKLLEVGFL